MFDSGPVDSAPFGKHRFAIAANEFSVKLRTTSLVTIFLPTAAVQPPNRRPFILTELRPYKADGNANKYAIRRSIDIKQTVQAVYANNRSADKHSLAVSTCFCKRNKLKKLGVV